MRSFKTLLVLFILLSCRFGDLDSGLIGTWDFSETKIVIRKDLGNMKFEFTSGTASGRISIDNRYEVTGRIGGAVIKNAKIEVSKNIFPPSITGISHVITCVLEGKIFEEDPLESKEVQFWIIHPLDENKFKSELRYTEGNAQFPMTEIEFTRIDS